MAKLRILSSSVHSPLHPVPDVPTAAARHHQGAQCVARGKEFKNLCRVYFEICRL